MFQRVGKFWSRKKETFDSYELENLSRRKERFDSYEAPAPAMEMVRGEPHLVQNLVDLRHVSRDQPLLKII